MDTPSGLVSLSNPAPLFLSPLAVIDWLAPSNNVVLLPLPQIFDTFSVYYQTFVSRLNIFTGGDTVYLPSLEFFYGGSSNGKTDFGMPFFSTFSSPVGATGIDVINPYFTIYGGGSIPSQVSSMFSNSQSSQQVIFKYVNQALFANSMANAVYPVRFSVNADSLKINPPKVVAGSLIAGDFCFTLLKIHCEQSPGWNS